MYTNYVYFYSLQLLSIEEQGVISIDNDRLFELEMAEIVINCNTILPISH